MKFKSEPNLFIRISNKYVQRASGIKGFYFNDKGEYSTENEVLLKLLSQNFETVQEKEEVKKITCNKCGEEFENNGLRLAHIRKHHPKEGK